MELQQKNFPDIHHKCNTEQALGTWITCPILATRVVNTFTQVGIEPKKFWSFVVYSIHSSDN